ncbi:MAG: protein translocase subunit SecF [Methylococcales bacterium]|nr:protein translocase subunit SecF [Methylococcales bacterium]
MNTTIDFISKRRMAVIVSSLLLIIAITSLLARGLNLGLDFTGGTLVELGYPDSVELNPLRSALAEAGFAGASVQHFGSTQDVLIRLRPDDSQNNAELSERVLAAVNRSQAKATLRRIEFVGPQVGDELTEDGGLATLYALLGVLIYVAWRFEWKFALGAVAALFHDVLITLGVFSVTALEFDLTVLAAVLAVIGYSLNDTIVVFDRIRENFIKLRKTSPEETINISLNETLSRTLMTSLTTLLVLVALATLGGETIRYFAIALIIGIFIGTYSSIYVASPVTLALGIKHEDMLPPVKEGADYDNLP